MISARFFQVKNRYIFAQFVHSLFSDFQSNQSLLFYSVFKSRQKVLYMKLDLSTNLFTLQN